ncbi:MAG TPA: NAD+ synthase, partial [Actinomycetes bacterium]|nr:NAD+ synthase [Actinomycetes bacterium]
AVVHRGQVVARYAKHHLPNYGVFDEFRYFVPGDRLVVVRVHGIDVAVAICEDLWQEGGPVASTHDASAGLLVVINASPYEQTKGDVRLDLVGRRAAAAGATLAYVNMVGGQDELVFDGDSLVASCDGSVLARAPQFEPGCLVVDLDLPEASADATELVPGVDRVVISEAPCPPYEPILAGQADRLSGPAEVYTALVTGLRDYVRKNRFTTVVLGLSGGIDSALTAAIACDAIGADNVHGVSLPSGYSSEHSRTDAAELAERTGLHYRSVAIAPMVEAFLAELKLTGLAEENLQARVRGMTLMGLSNQEGHLVLATGNKSELAVGYSTLYGDAVGGFAPLKDVPKSLVWELSRWRNAEATRRGETPPIPESSITKPPSAELRPGQLDTDSLPDYAELDAVLDAYIEADEGAAQIVAAGHDPALVERVLRLTDAAEYKRRQYPPGPKISLKAFGRDRRLPITNRWRESPSERG